MSSSFDADAVVVAGGGLAGLAAAAYVARAGRRVTLFEGARQVGGRAVSLDRVGWIFNLGAHALYRRGPAVRVLRELGVPFDGGVPPNAGIGLLHGREHLLPGGPLSLLRTTLLPPRAKLELAWLYASLPRMDLDRLQHVALRAWLDRQIRSAELRALIQALVRLTSYVNDPEQQSAGTALSQIRLALAGVYYLHGGWQTLVDGLRAAALAAGVRIETGRRVAGVEHDRTVRAVLLADGTHLPARAVILAVGPDTVRTLLRDVRPDAGALNQWVERTAPARVACLDLALRRLPRPSARFMLGIDQPLYLSVTSATARVAPAGGAVIQTMKYLHPNGDTDPRADERELEAAMDRFQPGWRAQLVDRRFLPHLVASHRSASAVEGGLRGRPDVMAAGVEGVYLAGDWVGPDGMLADAALASARRAAGFVLGAAAAIGRPPVEAGVAA